MLACLSVCVFMTVSCDDKDYYDPEKDPDYVDDTASTLDFSTSQTVKLVFNYDIADGFVSTFSLYTDYPMASNGSLRADLESVAAGIYVKGYSDITRIIPSYVTDLYLYSNTLFVPMLSHAKIENGVASFKMIDVEIVDNEGTRAGNAGVFWNKAISFSLKSQDDFYSEADAANKIYKYDLKNPDFETEIPSEVLTAIGNTFKEAKIVDEKYYKDATIKIQKGKDDQTGAEVFVSVLHSGAGFYNALSYFVYTGDEDLTTLPKAEVEALEVINLFQYADVYTNTVSSAKKNTLGLTPGKYVQLLYKNENGEYVKEFPIGAQIGWVLHPNSFKAESFAVQDNMGRIFSVSYWNDPKNKTNNPKVNTNNYNIFFSATANNGDVYNCFGFEDQPGSNSDGDCNDVIFHVLTNPLDAIIAPPSITEEEVENTETKKGILAFEDNWPEKGDYDLNDVVIKYSSVITYTQTIKTGEGGSVVGSTDASVKKVTDKFSFVHNGADFTNAFSYKVELSPNVIKSIVIADEKTGNVTDYTNKISADGSGFIIDVCSGNPIDRMQSGNYTYSVVMEFKDGMVLQDDFASVAAPYNPFITPTNGNYPNAEVHLSMYRPTNRVDMDLFGTKDDRSDKNKLWYVSGLNNKYPFAIHLNGVGEGFEIPKEKQIISETYPRYINWVESGMAEDKDWYLQK